MGMPVAVPHQPGQMTEHTNTDVDNFHCVASPRTSPSDSPPQADHPGAGCPAPPPGLPIGTETLHQGSAMAELVAAFGSSHSPMLASRLEDWQTQFETRDAPRPFDD